MIACTLWLQKTMKGRMSIYSVHEGAHHPSNPLEVLLEVLIAVAIALRDCDAAVVRAQQRCQAQGKAPRQLSLHTWMGVRQAIEHARHDAWSHDRSQRR